MLSCLFRLGSVEGGEDWGGGSIVRLYRFVGGRSVEDGSWVKRFFGFEGKMEFWYF